MQEPSEKKLPEELVNEYFIKQHEGQSRTVLRKQLKRRGLKRTEITKVLDVYKNTPEEIRGLRYHLLRTKI